MMSIRDCYDTYRSISRMSDLTKHLGPREYGELLSKKKKRNKKGKRP